jgi:hypothetical protein
MLKGGRSNVLQSWVLRSRRRAVLWVAVLASAGAGAGVAVAVSSSGGRYVPRLGATVPAGKLLPVEHAQPGTAPESTVPAPVPADTIAPIPAALSSADSTPVPVSPSLVRVRNAWMVGNGRTLVAVYAGAAGDDARNGRIVVIRQNLLAGTQSLRVLTMPGTGAVAIDSAPRGAGVETSGQSATLHFRGSSGRAGTLDLRLTRVTLR